jgi:hypothetical protein
MLSANLTHGLPFPQQVNLSHKNEAFVNVTESLFFEKSYNEL